MYWWEIVDGGFTANVEAIAYVKFNRPGEFTVGFIGGKEKEFTTEGTAEEILEELYEACNMKREEYVNASSEKLPKVEPAWQTLLGK